MKWIVVCRSIVVGLCWFHAFNACMAQEKRVGAFLEQIEKSDLSRFTKKWTVRKLASESDLVVIFGRDQQWHEDSNAPLPAELQDQKGWMSVFSCRLNPVAIITSRPHENGDSGIRLELAGWRVKPGFSSGPVLASWLPANGGDDTVPGDNAKPLILGFLKKNDARDSYEPVAGHYFAEFSFFELSSGIPLEVTGMEGPQESNRKRSNQSKDKTKVPKIHERHQNDPSGSN